MPTPTVARVPAARVLGEGDHELGPALGDEASACEKRFDPICSVDGRLGYVDAHPPPLVEPPHDEPGLLEHPDEDADVPLRRGGGELVGVDAPGRSAQRAVDAS